MNNSTMNCDHAPTLYSSFSLPNGISIYNRFFKSAMSEQLGNSRLLPDYRLVKVYQRWAKGGAGVLVTGNVMVDRTALGEYKNVVLDDQQDLQPFREWAEAVTKTQAGAHVWMQLNHPGKQSPKNLSPQPVAPSAVALGRGLDAVFNKPRELSDAEIRELIEKFASSAALAQEAGFTGVQIHGAHGYLVNQFLSPHHNRRTDRWGGSSENRRRFCLEVYRAIRARVGREFPVAIKINSADFQKGGFDENDAFDLIQVLSDEGIDHIEISGGNYESPAMTGAKQSTIEREAYFLTFAERAREITQVPLAVTGGFRSVKAMEQALTSKAVDFIGLARPLAITPDLPQRAALDSNYIAETGNPTCGLKAIDSMFALPIGWYETQIARMAKGKNPKPNLSGWWAVMDAVWSLGMSSIKPRRA